MRCDSCNSENQLLCPAEISLHYPERKNLTERPVWIFPTLRVCLDCGVTQFVISEAELKMLVAGLTLSRKANS
jgi:hypothetical protein